MVRWANNIFLFFNDASCFLRGTAGLGLTRSIKKWTPTIESIVNTATSTKGARQLKASPSINPTGTPNAIDPLTPIDTIPMARPRYFGSTILGAITRQRIMSNEPQYRGQIGRAHV